MGRPLKNKPTPTTEKKAKAKPIVKPEAETKPAIEETKLEKPEIKTEILESEAEKLEILETQPESKPVDQIFEKYMEKCAEESDINLLLPKIFEIASDCQHVTEFGVRRPTSTYALLAAKPARVVSYDIGRWDDVDEVEQLCLEAGQNFQFITQNVLEADIEQTDMILSDTHHSYHQIRRELERHTSKVRKYWLFHDWETYKNQAEAWYPGVADHFGCQDGIGRAIYEFLDANKDWELYFETPINNGLVILKRV